MQTHANTQVHRHTDTHRYTAVYIQAYTDRETDTDYNILIGYVGGSQMLLEVLTVEHLLHV